MAAPPLQTPQSAFSRFVDTPEALGAAMWVKLRATHDQRTKWYEKAQACGVSFSEFARQALDGVAVRKRRGPRAVDPKLVQQLARLGNNLNQLARWANRDQRYANRVDILAQLIGIERELEHLRKAYEVPNAD